MKFVRAMSWTRWLVTCAALNAAISSVVTYVAFHKELGLPGPHASFWTILGAYYYGSYVDLLTPNQVMHMIAALGDQRYFDRLGRVWGVIFAFAGGSLISMWLSLVAGRKLDLLQKRYGVWATAALYLAVTLILDLWCETGGDAHQW
jgi:hypothetical protein